MEKTDEKLAALEKVADLKEKISDAKDQVNQRQTSLNGVKEKTAAENAASAAKLQELKAAYETQRSLAEKKEEKAALKSLVSTFPSVDVYHFEGVPKLRRFLDLVVPDRDVREFVDNDCQPGSFLSDGKITWGSHLKNPEHFNLGIIKAILTEVPVAGVVLLFVGFMSNWFTPLWSQIILFVVLGLIVGVNLIFVLFWLISTHREYVEDKDSHTYGSKPNQKERVDAMVEENAYEHEK
jgi:hypothetical protein